MPWRSILSYVLHQDSNASLYYAVLHVWMGLGQSEAIVRLLSVLLGSGTVLALYALGNRLFGRTVALVASLLLAVNGFHIHYSQEARSYSLLVFLATISSLFFLMSMERPIRRNWFLYVLTGALVIYAHVFGILVLAAHWGSLVFLRRREVPWKGLLASTAAVGLLASPVGILLFARASEPNVPLAWAHRPTLYNIYELFCSLAGNADFRDAPGCKPIVAAYFVVCLVTFLSGIRFGAPRKVF
jgi:mannosyltransferase